MRRRLVLAALVIVTLGLGGWRLYEQREQARLVHVGGDSNPCACSTRIEP
jgi:hypothetical protein